MKSSLTIWLSSAFLFLSTVAMAAPVDTISDKEAEFTVNGQN
ncbi:MAG: hypothetical protein WD077_08695 [Bacteroidia bacterium]